MDSLAIISEQDNSCVRRSYRHLIDRGVSDEWHKDKGTERRMKVRGDLRSRRLGIKPRLNLTAPPGDAATLPPGVSRVARGHPMTTLEEVRARFARDQGLPFADSLTEISILNALDQHDVNFRDRIFSPVTTIWGFLSQVFSDDHSCRDAVSRILAHRAASDLESCSPNTASYCDARARLPAAVLRTLAKQTARQLQETLPEAWKWNGRNGFIAAGSHVSMPDTPENQAAYLQPVVQQPGIGFPLARLTVLLSLATGACHDLAIAPYAGKGTGATTLLRQMYPALKPGDVVLADALFDNYFVFCALRQLRIDLVTRVQAERVGSTTIASRLDGDIIVWQRPNKPRSMSGEKYRSYPETALSEKTYDRRPKSS